MKTDVELQRDVVAELKWDPSINASHIDISVYSGVVSLFGIVDMYAHKWNAENAVLRVTGVKAVNSNLVVNLLGSTKPNDIDMMFAAQHVLSWTSALPSGQVRVLVENGWVTLSGVVDWEYQRVLAVTVLRHLSFVTGFTNLIVVKPKVSFRAVKSDIETAIQRQVLNTAPTIDIDVRGTDIILTGTVRSGKEKKLARRTAWNTPGVHEVIDNIVVSY